MIRLLDVIAYCLLGYLAGKRIRSVTKLSGWLG